MEIEGFLIPARAGLTEDMLRQYEAAKAAALHRAAGSPWNNHLTFQNCDEGDWRAAIFIEERCVWRSPAVLSASGGETLTVELEAAAEFGSFAFEHEAKRRGAGE